MRFKHILKKKKTLAFSYEGENFQFIFGTRNLNFKNLHEMYPFLKFHRLKQVHGKNLIKVNQDRALSLDHILMSPSKGSSFLNADAHWTQHHDLFLSIQTADCLPVLISNGEKVAALHIGWKGLIQGILPKVLKNVFSKALKSKVIAAIGPHIQDISFEVRKDVRDRIAFCYKKYFPLMKDRKPIFFPHQDQDKCFVSLKNFCLTEFLFFGLSPKNIFISNEDTFSSPHYFSYRKDGKKNGFQISGVFKKKTN